MDIDADERDRSG